MKIKAFVEVEVKMADGSEPLASMTDEIHQGLSKYVRYGVHMLSEATDKYKFTVDESGTEEIQDEKID